LSGPESRGRAISIMDEQQNSADLSLFDVVLDEYRYDKASRCSRILLCGVLDKDHSNNPNHFTQLIKFHNDFINSIISNNNNNNNQNQNNNDAEHINANYDIEKISGILFHINNSAFSLLLESTTNTILQYLRHITALSSLSPSLLNPLQIKVISFTEESPREFSIFAGRSIRLPADEFVSPKDWLRFTFESLRNLLELARELQHVGQSEEKQVEFIQNNNSKGLLARIPTAERIVGYLTCEDLCSPQEFLELFDSPVEFVLESERVWPSEPFLKY
jgi:hypothetical protein